MEPNVTATLSANGGSASAISDLNIGKPIAGGLFPYTLEVNTNTDSARSIRVQRPRHLGGVPQYVQSPGVFDQIFSLGAGSQMSVSGANCLATSSFIVSAPA